MAERLLIYMPALACPGCGAWDRQDGGEKVWLRTTYTETDPVENTRMRRMECRNCGKKFDVMLSPNFRKVTIS
ncbi:MAG TPA: hypothetical protein VMY69_09320 [Phycisphaerae bacterium]|nr:hypothetical protein [Phycisphaerae bacterium]